MITLSPALPLTVALCTLSLLPAGLRIYINPTWLIVESEAPPEDLKQPPVDAESMTTEWDSSIDVQSPYGLVRIMMDAVIEGLRKLPFVGESMVPKRHSSTGPRSPQSWVRLRKDVAPVGPKELPVVAKSVASDPPYPLGQLWDSLAQADRTQLCCRALQSLWLCFLSWVALRLWRNGNRPQGQVSNRDRSHRKGAACGEQGSTSLQALAKKACNEKTKPSAGKKASAGPESSSASSPVTCSAVGQKPSGGPSTTWGLPEVCSAQRAAQGSPARLESFQRKPSPAGHFSATRPAPTSLRPRPCHFQGKERPASSSVGTDCSEEGTFSSDEAVHQLEAKITPLARCTRLVYRLRLKVFPHQHSEKKAEGEASGGEPSLAPCAPPPRACSRRIGKRRCRGASECRRPCRVGLEAGENRHPWP